MPTTKRSILSSGASRGVHELSDDSRENPVAIIIVNNSGEPTPGTAMVPSYLIPKTSLSKYNYFPL